MRLLACCLVVLAGLSKVAFVDEIAVPNPSFIAAGICLTICLADYLLIGYPVKGKQGYLFKNRNM